MATFESIINSVRDVAVSTGQKASDLAARAKIKLDIDAQEKKLAAAFEGIGRLVYDTEKNGTDNTDMLATAYQTVDELQKEIDELRDKHAQMKGAVRCADCNTANEYDAEFCKKCGKAL